MLSKFYINWIEEPIKFFNIGIENNKCEVFMGILGNIGEKIEKNFKNHEEAKEFFDNEINEKINNKYFETLGGEIKLENIFKDENIGLLIKDDPTQFYTYKYLTEFETGAIIFLEVENGLITNRSKIVYQDLINNQSEYKRKIFKSIFDYHKETFENYMEGCGIQNIKDEYENFKNNYEPFDWSLERFMEFQINNYQEMMKGWRDILNAENYYDKQEIISKEIELTEITILSKLWDKDIKFSYEYPNFDPEHGFEIWLKDREVLDIG